MSSPFGYADAKGTMLTTFTLRSVREPPLLTCHTEGSRLTSSVTCSWLREPLGKLPTRCGRNSQIEQRARA